MHHVNKFLSKVLLVLGIALIAGCATQPPIVTNHAVTPPPVSIPTIAPTNLQNMKYMLVTKDTLSVFTAELNANPANQFYVLDRPNMEIMIANVQQMRSYILQQQATINYLAGALNLETSKPGTAVAPTGASSAASN